MVFINDEFEKSIIARLKGQKPAETLLQESVNKPWYISTKWFDEGLKKINDPRFEEKHRN